MSPASSGITREAAVYSFSGATVSQWSKGCSEQPPESLMAGWLGECHSSWVLHPSLLLLSCIVFALPCISPVCSLGHLAAGRLWQAGWRLRVAVGKLYPSLSLQLCSVSYGNMGSFSKLRFWTASHVAFGGKISFRCSDISFPGEMAILLFVKKSDIPQIIFFLTEVGQ